MADLRQLTEQYGALLIFDEIVTGFRLSLGGAQEYFSVKPDLAVFAKGISNGVPPSCYVGPGRRDGYRRKGCHLFDLRWRYARVGGCEGGSRGL